jgi:serine/threonine protein kinase
MSSPTGPSGRPEHAGRSADGKDDGDTAFDLESLWRIVEATAAETGGEETVEDPFVGTTIGTVTLLRLLGTGGMGRVYEGIQEQPRRPVALKLQRPGRFDREGTRRFLRELELLGRLAHPALCRVYAAGIHPWGGERLPWFAMELVPDAAPITHWAAQRAMALPEKVALFRVVCAGVAVAHAAGIVHRDLKAGNILVGSDGQPKVIDFGVAAVFRGADHATSLTDTGRLVGSLEAVAPEMLVAAEPGGSPRGDVWALGVVLHRLVTGAPPIVIDGRSIAGVIAAIRTFRPDLAARTRGAAGRAVAAVVDRALAPDPALRFADAAEMGRALADVLGRFPVDSAAWESAQDLDLGTPRITRRRWFVPAVGALGLAAGGALWMATDRSRDRDSRPEPRGVDPLRPAFEPPAFSTSPIGAADFSHAVRDVVDPEAERYLVEATGARKWREPFDAHNRYWGPKELDVPATLVFRYDFPRPSRRIHLKAFLWTWDDQQTAGVVGRGVGAIEFSTDGAEWQSLFNGIEPPAYGDGFEHDGLLPETATGSTGLWLSVRLLQTGVWANGSYSVAQFMSCNDDQTDTRFEIAVECVPEEDRR